MVTGASDAPIAGFRIGEGTHELADMCSIHAILRDLLVFQAYLFSGTL